MARVVPDQVPSGTSNASSPRRLLAAIIEDDLPGPTIRRLVRGRSEFSFEDWKAMIRKRVGEAREKTLPVHEEIVLPPRVESFMEGLLTHYCAPIETRRTRTRQTSRQSVETVSVSSPKVASKSNAPRRTSERRNSRSTDEYEPSSSDTTTDTGKEEVEERLRIGRRRSRRQRPSRLRKRAVIRYNEDTSGDES